MRLFQIGGSFPHRVSLHVKNWQHLLALPILVVPLAACMQPLAMYEGGRQSPDSIATLERQVRLSCGLFRLGQWATVEKVDGAEPPGLGILLHDLELLPGQRTASLDLLETFGYFSSSIAEPSITFVAQAGHKYCIPTLKLEEQVWIWVLDWTTGKTVAGLEPIDLKVSCKCFQGFGLPASCIIAER